jgi:hypothetical protein
MDTLRLLEVPEQYTELFRCERLELSGRLNAGSMAGIVWQDAGLGDLQYELVVAF